MKFTLFILLLILGFSCKTDTDQTKTIKKEKTSKTEKVFSKKKRTSVKQSDKKTKVNTKSFQSYTSSEANAKIDPHQINIRRLRAMLHDEINKVRKANKLPLLKEDVVLRLAAKDQNDYCIRKNRLDHYQESSHKRTVKDRIEAHGGRYQLMAENLIFEGFTVRTINGKPSAIITPTYQEMVKQMVRSWLESAPHRKNIMNPALGSVGTWAAYNPKKHAIFATQVFGKK